jgi:ubiquinone/menaquinone biosynthesis C-methylase UbiE
MSGHEKLRHLARVRQDGRMNDPKALVAAGYDQIHEAYVVWGGGDEVVRRRYLDLVIDEGRVAPGGDLLDLGCGTGALATQHLAERFRITGVDLSPKSIDVARRAIPEGRFVAADMATVDFPSASFDVVTAFYSLIHVPRDEHATVLERIESWLRPGGILVVTMGTTAGDAFDPSWLGTPMFRSSWDTETNVRLVEAAGFEVVRSTIEEVVEHGRPIAFLWVVARKPATATR